MVTREWWWGSGRRREPTRPRRMSFLPRINVPRVLSGSMSASPWRTVRTRVHPVAPPKTPREVFLWPERKTEINLYTPLPSWTGQDYTRLWTTKSLNLGHKTFLWHKKNWTLSGKETHGPGAYEQQCIRNVYQYDKCRVLTLHSKIPKR